MATRTFLCDERGCGEKWKWEDHGEPDSYFDELLREHAGWVISPQGRFCEEHRHRADDPE
jgi:hypothetical protein